MHNGRSWVRSRISVTMLEGELRHLIVTADDFGLADEVNQAVRIAHSEGILSAASLMVAGAAAQDAVRCARDLPGLRVGLHIVLVDGEPTLPPEQIPGLVDVAGRLRGDLVRLAVEIARSSQLRAELRAEISAQFTAFLRTGLRLDHVNAHKHYHLHPLVAREIIAVGRQFGIAALRIPAEPTSVISLVEPRSVSAASVGVSACAALQRAQARRAGLLVPDAVFGLAWTGAFTKARLAGLLRHLPAGILEIYTHPATANAFGGSSPGYRYAEELEALCAPDVLAQARKSGLEPIGYADLLL